MDLRAWSEKALEHHLSSAWTNALEAYQVLMVMQPNDPVLFYNCALVFHAQRQLHLARIQYENAILLQPCYFDAHNNLSLVLMDLRCHSQALTVMDRAICMRAENMGLRWNKALLLLKMKQYALGWQAFELRWQWEHYQSVYRWDRSTQLSQARQALGKRVLIHCEHGLGDVIQFSRFIAKLAELEVFVIFELPHALFELMKSLRGVSQWIEQGDPIPAHDFHSPLLSLPLVLELHDDAKLSSAPYLFSQASQVQVWATKLAQKTMHGLKIGVVWSSASGLPGDELRSMTFVEFSKALPQGAHAYICLQKETQAKDVAAMMARGDLIEFEDGLSDFSQTAALIENLDLVISTCTSVLHLSAAMGKPTWAVLGFTADWRWAECEQKSHWYDSLEIFRQSEEGQWSCVLQAIHERLLGRNGTIV